jgi:S-DNA-T family DNA segregation ATPase FtsK/SpoIIIE
MDVDGAPGDTPIVNRMAASWERPPLDLLKDAPAGGISKEEMAETAETIRQTLADYNVEVEIGQIKPGPTVTMYGLVPGWVRRYKQVKVTDDKGKPKRDESGKPLTTRAETKTRVKVDSIMSREKDLALALKTHSLRIETPVLGESLVGIEVPNPNSTLVTLRSVVESEEFKRLSSKAQLPIALGRGTGGEAIVVDLAKMPHLLVAGATGSGKSVCINTIVSCLIMEKTPAELRLLLVDPKRVELTSYNGIPHLLTPVVVETDEVVALLKGLIREMLNRYRRMEEVSVRNIESYNRKMPDQMPYLVVAVDELADLMMSASFDVEQSLCRLAQLGRATGIHLIVATQRPSVDVVTGLIKANFPSRISFGVTSQIDSRTILDTVGAEKLLGRGDMLYQGVDASRPERVQGVFISDNEIEDIVGFWQNTPWAPLPTVSLHTVGDGDSDSAGEESGDKGSRDALLDKAIELAHSNKKISTSFLQRRMRIGYPRAARLMDQLEDEGIVGPSDGSKSRDVIIGAI